MYVWAIIGWLAADRLSSLSVRKSPYYCALYGSE